MSFLFRLFPRLWSRNDADREGPPHPITRPGLAAPVATSSRSSVPAIPVLEKSAVESPISANLDWNQDGTIQGTITLTLSDPAPPRRHRGRRSSASRQTSFSASASTSDVSSPTPLYPDVSGYGRGATTRVYTGNVTLFPVRQEDIHPATTELSSDTDTIARGHHHTETWGHDVHRQQPSYPNRPTIPESDCSAVPAAREPPVETHGTPARGRKVVVRLPPSRNRSYHDDNEDVTGRVIASTATFQQIQRGDDDAPPTPPMSEAGPPHPPPKLPIVKQEAVIQSPAETATTPPRPIFQFQGISTQFRGIPTIPTVPITYGSSITQITPIKQERQPHEQLLTPPESSKPSQPRTIKQEEQEDPIPFQLPTPKSEPSSSSKLNPLFSFTAGSSPKPRAGRPPIKIDESMPFTSLEKICSADLENGRHRVLPRWGPPCLAANCGRNLRCVDKPTQSGRNEGRAYYKCPQHGWDFGTFADLEGRDADGMKCWCREAARKTATKHGGYMWTCLEARCRFKEFGN